MKSLLSNSLSPLKTLKSLTSLMAVALVALTTLGTLASCSDDDDEPAAAEAKTLKWTIATTLNETAATMFDYTVTLALPDGTTRTVPVNYSTSAKATGYIDLADVTLPATFTMTVTRTTQSDFAPADDEKADFSEAITISVEAVDADDNTLAGNTKSVSTTATGVRLAEYAATVNGKTSTCTLTAKKQGTNYTIE